MGSSSEESYTKTGGVPVSAPEALRQRAEELAAESPSPAEVGLPASALKDSQIMLHELQLHQIELQLQNDELRRTQTALDAARAHFFDLYDLAPAGYCTLSKYGMILEANLTAASMLNFSRSVLLYQRFSRFIPAEDQGIFYLHLRKLSGAGQGPQEDSAPPSKCELRMTRKDGVPFWAQLTLTTVSAADLDTVLSQGPGTNIPASAPLFRVVITDITESKRTEQALRDSEATLNSFFNSTQAMMGILRALPDLEDLEYLRLNPIASRRLGVPLEALPGALASQFGSSEEHCRLWLEHCRRCQESSQTVQFEYQSARLNGAWLLATINGIEPGVFSFSITDVTVLKNVQHELQQLNTELEERVVQRTADLSQSNQDLKRAVRLRDEFLNNMSHELRTPLTGILGFSDALQARVYGELNVGAARAVDKIHINGERLLLLVNNLLELSKLVAGKVVLHPALVNVDRLIQACLDPVQPEIERKRLVPHTQIDTQLDFILADEKYLKQILHCLLDNAVKFTPQGGSVGLEVNADPDAGQVRWVVWDSGIGIPPEQYGQIFEPFVQIDGSLSRAYGGTGLGLAMAKELVNLHGGSVEVHSAPGEGSRFIVSLPWQPVE